MSAIVRKDEVLFELLQRLHAMGIDPLGSADRSPALVEKRIWRPPQEAPIQIGAEETEAFRQFSPEART